MTKNESAMPAILLFVKFPEPGKVKTRLGAKIGHAQAAAAYRQMVETVCRQLPKNASLTVMFDPPEKRVEIEQWIGSLLANLTTPARFIAQSSGDLGARLTHAFHEIFSATKDFANDDNNANGKENNERKIAVIGSDCIDIAPKIFQETWNALDEKDCVVGPSEDGGYYLLALKKPCDALFQNIAWSTPETLAQTLQRAREVGLSLHLLPILSDLDTENEWKNVQHRL